MEAIRVQYQVRPEFADTNAANIQKVMTALRENPIDGLTYTAFKRDDGNTFIHLVVARDDKTRAKITELPEFKAFQAALQESQPIVPPQPEDLAVVDASYAL